MLKNNILSYGDRYLILFKFFFGVILMKKNFPKKKKEGQKKIVYLKERN